MSSVSGVGLGGVGLRGRVLAVSGYGGFLGKRGERFVFRGGRAAGTGARGSGREAEFPAREVDLILVLGRGVTISSDAVRLASSRGVPVFFAHPSGYPYAAVMPAVSTGSADTRRQQVLARYDERGTELVREFVRGKVLNQASLLREAAASRGRSGAEVADLLREAAGEVAEAARDLDRVSGTLEEAAPSLRAVEGRAARAYWEAFSLMIPGRLGFPGRVTRGASDLVNCLLNFGYGYLRVRVATAVFYAGLDPYAGFLHEDRAGRPSMVLDLMEEFRPPVVDRAVLNLVARRVASPEWLEGEELSREALSSLMEALEDRLDRKVTLGGRRVRLRTAVRMQARAVVGHLKGTGRYRPVLYPGPGRWGRRYT